MSERDNVNFYEDDEPAEKVWAAFDAASHEGWCSRWPWVDNGEFRPDVPCDCGAGVMVTNCSWTGEASS